MTEAADMPLPLMRIALALLAMRNAKRETG